MFPRPLWFHFFSQWNCEYDLSMTTIIGEIKLSIHLALNLTPWLSRSGLRVDGEVIEKRVSVVKENRSEGEVGRRRPIGLIPQFCESRVQLQGWADIAGQLCLPPPAPHQLRLRKTTKPQSGKKHHNPGYAPFPPCSQAPHAALTDTYVSQAWARLVQKERPKPRGLSASL